MDVIMNGDLETSPQYSKPLLTQGNFYHNILVQLGFDADFPPVADLIRQVMQLEGDWVIATPVHWQASHNNAVIAGSGKNLCLTERESYRSFEKWRKFVAEEGMEAQFYDEEVWLLKPNDKPKLYAKPVHSMLQRSLLPELQQLDETLYWQKLITECQMLFASRGVESSQLINGVWFWGQGSLLAKGDIPLLANQKKLLELGAVLSSRVSPFSAENVASDEALILWENTAENDRVTLQRQLQNKSVSWYGNDIAYQSQKKNWWSRIWRF